MKKLLLAGLASVAVALPVAAALQKGDAAPAFTAKASLAGKEFNYSLADALKQGTVVVYFYPSAYTQGCNIQAHTFAENMEALKHNFLLRGYFKTRAASPSTTASPSARRSS